MSERTSKRLAYYYLLYFIFGWTIVMLGLLIYNYVNLNQATNNLAYQEANSFFNRDKVFRVWATGHGGFYVPQTEKTPANPYLEHIPDRDITTSSGKKLTLMNPAYALRQINEDFTRAIGISGHITSLKPLRPENSPDPWEAKALKEFEKGIEVASEFVEVEGIRSFRLMRPLNAAEGCLKCHGHQGYKVGDIRGGVSVTIPLTPYLEQESKTWAGYWTSYTALWILGIIAFIIAYIIIKKYIKKDEEKEVKLLELKDSLEKKVEERTIELLESNNELIEAKVQAERYLSLAAEVILSLDKKGNITLLNGSGHKLLGYKTGELIGKNWFTNCLPEKNVEKIKKVFKGIISGQIKNFANFEANIQTKDGEIRTILWHNSILQNKEGEITGTLSSGEDITNIKKSEIELIKAKKRAEQSDRLKSAFLATMSHELRTPLNSIIGFSDLINEDEDIENIKQFNNTVHSSGHQLLRIIEDLFDISLLATGQSKVNNEVFEVNSLMQNVHSIMENEKHHLNKNNIELINSNESYNDELFIYTDNAKLKQILINLLKNALKFTPEGSINFGCNKIKENDNDFLKFYISDTGIGREEEKFDVIFDNFKQIDDSYTRTFGGAGIGLSISKKLTELLGGRIWVESKVGQGSTFYFTIPINKEIDISKPESKILPDDSTMKDKLVLIVEDDVNSFEFLKILITKSGIKYYWAKDGLEAIKYCKENDDIELVLMDINMPIMNGYEATKEIKKFRPDLPILAQTAYAISGDHEKAIKAGCDDYITKPIKMSVFNEKIKKYMKS